MILAQLSVRRSREALAFYEAAFGATVDHLVGDEDIVAQLSAYGGTFWIAEESPTHQNFSPETLGGGTARLLLMVDDPDAAVERAVAAGATLVYAPEEAHGWLIGRIADLRLRREPSPPVRLHESTETVLTIANTGRRALRAVVRDAWVPSAGARPRAQDVVVPPGEQSLHRVARSDVEGHGIDRNTTHLQRPDGGDPVAYVCVVSVAVPVAPGRQRRPASEYQTTRTEVREPGGHQ